MAGIKSPPSLVSGLVKGAALWAVPALMLTALILTLLSRQSTYRSFDEPLEAAVIGLIASAEVSNDGTIRLSRELPDPNYQRALSGRYWLIGTTGDDGEILPSVSSRSLYGASLFTTPTVTAKLALQNQEAVRTVMRGPDEDANEMLRVVARQVVLPNMDTPVIVLAAADRRPAISAIRNFTLTAIGLMSILIIGLIIFILTLM